jgi:hypothetical protein
LRKIINGKHRRNEMSEKQNVTAYRGYYLRMDDFIPLVVQLLNDAHARRTGLVVIGNEEIAKLEGATMALMALKEATFRMEVYGDLIPLQEPLTKKETGEDVSKIVGENGEAFKKEETDRPL